MMLRKFAILSATALMVSPAAAQTAAMSAAEILALLIAQREQLALDAELGATRTLEFVDASNPDGSSDTLALGTTIEGDMQMASTEGVVMPEGLVIDLTIFFEFDSALLKDESKAQVDALCSAIQANEAANVAATEGEEGGAAASNQPAMEIVQGSYQIIGHTDASGSVQYNLSLSTARAEEVVRYMVRECGIDGNLLQAVGMGEARLKDPSNPGADANRRVEIQIAL